MDSTTGAECREAAAAGSDLALKHERDHQTVDHEGLDEGEADDHGGEDFVHQQVSTGWGEALSISPQFKYSSQMRLR